MNRAWRWISIAGLVLILAAANYTIWQRQQVVDNGRLMLLDLRPVDPRSLMQGDYMVLRYARTLFPEGNRKDMPRSGAFLVKLDENNVATFSRLDTDGPLAENEAWLQYKLVDKNGEMHLGAESFFFQEGRANEFNRARYGALRVGPDGKSVLVGLANEQFELIN